MLWKIIYNKKNQKTWNKKKSLLPAIYFLLVRT